MKNLVHKKLIPIYDEMLYVAFDREAAFSQFGFSKEQREKHSRCNGFAFEGVDHKGDIVYAMFITKNHNGCINVQTTAHECFHIADMILEKKGMQYHHGSGNEHMAYLIDYLVGVVFDCLELDSEYQSKNNGDLK